MAPGEVAAVVLAAGASRRMGGDNKLLAPIDGVPMVRRVADVAAASAAAEVIVVTGHQAEPVRGALLGVDVRFIHNPRATDGLSASLGAGIGAVARAHTGAVVLLGDMPYVRTEVVDALIERFHGSNGTAICRPTFEGRPGNPVLWPREFFADILQLEGDTGARRLIERFADRVSMIAVADAGIHRDVDAPEDLT